MDLKTSASAIERQSAATFDAIRELVEKKCKNDNDKKKIKNSKKRRCFLSAQLQRTQHYTGEHAVRSDSIFQRLNGRPHETKRDDQQKKDANLYTKN